MREQQITLTEAIDSALESAEAANLCLDSHDDRDALRAILWRQIVRWAACKLQIIDADVVEAVHQEDAA